MADQRIELEIVMDDGSIKKAFGTIRSEAKKTQQESGKMMSSIMDGGSAMVVLNQGLELFNKISYALKKTTQEIISLSLEAEKVRVTQAQFAALTQQNTINTKAFDEAIQRSVAGLLDDEDALNVANQAMIRLGSTAQRLPEIFELARKASASGFGDMASNAELLTRAIQTGEVRQLRSIGLTVELAKAQNEFAKSLGLTAAQLTEEQKAFVNSNVILEEASKRFSNTDANIKTFSDSLTRLSVNLTNLAESAAVKFDNAFGVVIKNAINKASFAISEFLGTTSTDQRIEQLRVKLKSLSDSYDEIARGSKLVPAIIDVLAPSANIATLDRLNSQMSNIRSQIAELSKIDYAKSGSPNDLLAKRMMLYSQEQEARKLNEEQRQQAYEAELQRQQSLQQASAGFQQQEFAAKQQLLQNETDSDARSLQQAALYQEQLRLIVEQGAIARQNIAIQYSDAKGFTQAERDALELQQVEAQNSQVLAAQLAYQQQSQDAFTKFINSSKKSFAEMGAAAKITFVTQIGGAFAAFGNALAKGEDALAAFGKAILGTLGDVAIQMGQSFILQGIANSLNPLTPGSGAGLIAAGAALSVFGGFLKGLSGGGGAGAGAGAGGGAGADTGGGVAAQGLDTGPMGATGFIAESRVAPNTVVNFTVQGDILDSDSTQSRIVSLLNDAIDTKGAVVRGLA